MNSGIPKLWTAEIISRVLTAVATVYTARILGVETYGVVGYVAAAVSYVSVFVRFGTDHILVRELSRAILPDHEKSALRSTTIIIRIAFAALATIVLLILGLYSKSQLLSRLYFANIVGILGLFLPLDVLLQSEGKFGVMALSRVFFNICNLVLIMLFLRDPILAWWIPLASGLSLLTTQAFFFRRLKGRFSVPDVTLFKRLSLFLIVESAPVFMSMFLLLFIGQLGIILVRQFSSPTELGLYVGGYRIYEIGNAMIAPVAVTLFPKLAEIWVTAKPHVRTDAILSGIRVATPLVLTMVGLSSLCGKDALVLLLGDRFGGSAPYVTILLGTLFFRSVSMFFANALVAAGKQRQHLQVTAAIVALNVLLGLPLIGFFGAHGAAWTNFGAFLIELVGFSWMIHASINLGDVFRGILRVTISGVFAYGIGYALSQVISPIKYAPFAAGAVFCLIFGTLFFKSAFFRPSMRLR